MFSDQHLRNQLSAVVPKSDFYWKASKLSLAAVLFITFLFGRYNSIAHQIIGLFAINAAGCAAIAMFLEAHVQRITGQEVNQKTGSSVIAASAIIIATCCGILENSYSILSLTPGWGSAVSAKALSTLLSSIGTSILFAGVVGLFSTAKTDRYNLKRESFKVESCKLEYGYFSVKKHITVRTSDDILETAVINISQADDILQPMINRCLSVKPGDTVELCYSRIISGYCVVTAVTA